MTARVLIVAASDEDAITGPVAELGLSPVAVARPSEALSRIATVRPSVIIVDATTPTISAPDVVAELKQLQGAPVLVVAALGDIDARKALVSAGADDFVTAPVTPLELTIRLTTMGRLLRLTDELRRTRAALEQALTLDPVTATHTAHAMRTHLGREFARSRRYGRDLALLVLELDRGDASGDLLADVADNLRRNLRETDLIGRDGGAFWILAPETSTRDAVDIAERLRREINDATDVTASVGVAMVPDVRVATAEQLLSLAVEAVEAARARGRNGCVVA